MGAGLGRAPHALRTVPEGPLHLTSTAHIPHGLHLQDCLCLRRHLCGLIQFTERKSIKPVYSVLTDEIDKLTQAGVMEPGQLDEPSFSSLHHEGLDGAFGDSDADAIVGVLAETFGGQRRSHHTHR